MSTPVHGGRNGRQRLVLKPDAEKYPLGKSRPPLGVDDLPEPEEVFKAGRLGPLQIVQFVVGPSLIALGISVGSGVACST